MQDLLGHSTPATTATYTTVDAHHMGDVIARITVPMAATEPAPVTVGHP